MLFQTCIPQVKLRALIWACMLVTCRIARSTHRAWWTEKWGEIWKCAVGKCVVKSTDHYNLMVRGAVLKTKCWLSWLARWGSISFPNKWETDTKTIIDIPKVENAIDDSNPTLPHSQRNCHPADRYGDWVVAQVHLANMRFIRMFGPGIG